MAHSFGKDCRLLKTEDFSSVFALKRQRARTLVQVFCAESGMPRLGLVVGKKTARRANRRNYMKRVLREWFRLHRHALPPQDVVVRVRRPFGREDAARVRAELAELLLPRPAAQSGTGQPENAGPRKPREDAPC